MAEIDKETVNAAAPFMAGLFTHGEKDTVAQLIAGKCLKCGAYSFPQREICAICGPGPELKRVTLNGDGIVYASTCIRVPSPVGIQSPYGYGYVDLDDAPLRVFALFGNECVPPPAPGARVRLVVQPLYRDRTGQLLLSHRFVPVAVGEALE